MEILEGKISSELRLAILFIWDEFYRLFLLLGLKIKESNKHVNTQWPTLVYLWVFTIFKPSIPHGTPNESFMVNLIYLNRLALSFICFKIKTLKQERPYCIVCPFLYAYSERPFAKNALSWSAKTKTFKI